MLGNDPFQKRQQLSICVYCLSVYYLFERRTLRGAVPFSKYSCRWKRLHRGAFGPSVSNVLVVNHSCEDGQRFILFDHFDIKWYTVHHIILFEQTSADDNRSQPQENWFWSLMRHPTFKWPYKLRVEKVQNLLIARTWERGGIFL